MERLAILSKHFTRGVVYAELTEAERARLLITKDEYERLYAWSLDDPAGFWAHMAQNLYWEKKWQQDHVRYNFDVRQGPIQIEFFKGAKTNIAYNCLDKWVKAGMGNEICFFWEGNDLGHERAMTYQQVLDEVCRVGNWLRAEGVRPGDAVTIYLPMICELPITMLACARIGAVHSVVFGGFSSDSLGQRIADCKSRIVVTASGVYRGTKLVELKKVVDTAIDLAAQQGFNVDRVLVWEKTAVPKASCPWTPRRDAWWREEIPRFSGPCPVEWRDAEDPLFLLYTSGSTGKPKGVVHTTGGYMVYAYTSCRYVFDLRPGDMYWSTADCGWITGHTYLTYGPLLCGCSQVVFGSTPTHPDAGRCWNIIEKYRVRVFYTAPTMLRSLLQHGDEWVTKHDLSSLRILAVAGEPINSHAWEWYQQVVGGGRCPIMDTWWQTETGGMMITPQLGGWCPAKAGSATLPFFGVKPVLLDKDGTEQQGACEGVLCVKGAWPGMARTLAGDHARFQEVYFNAYKGYYFTGDGARRDEDGCYWITGRLDDVINVSGHRIGTAEVEDALTQHDLCSESAVIGVDHPVKGQAVYAYVTLRDGVPMDQKTKKLLIEHVRQVIGAFAIPDVIHWAPGLPKTRSGKIMRRVLRKIASGEYDQLGDVSTLAEPAVVEELIRLKDK